MPGAWRSLISVNALVYAALAVGFLNNILIASLFGLTERVDAFFAAMMLPNLFMALCVDYLGKNFLPVYASARREGDERASRLASCIVTVVGLLACAVAAALVLAEGPLFTLLLPGFDSETVALVGDYFLIMAPAIVLMAVNTFHEYVCQHDEKFTAVMAVRMLMPVANLAAIVLLGPFIGEYALPWGYLAGHAVVTAVMALMTPYRFRPTLAVNAAFERRVFSNTAIVMGTGFIARSKSIVMNYLASSLGGGAISALALTAKLTEPLQRSVFSGVRMLMFSHTARLVVDDRHDEAGRLYALGLCVSFLLLTPLLWWIAFNAGEIVRVLFGRGEFTPAMGVLVAGTLLALTPSVLFIGVNQILSNAFYAMDRIKVPAIVMPLGMVVYVLCAVPLSRALGAQGLALSTSLMSVVMFAILTVSLSRLLTKLRLAETLPRLGVYVVLSGAVMAGVTVGLNGLGLEPAAVAVASLPVGAGLYAAVLAVARDATFVRVLRFVRGLGPAPRSPA